MGANSFLTNFLQQQLERVNLISSDIESFLKGLTANFSDDAAGNVSYNSDMICTAKLGDFKLWEHRTQIGGDKNNCVNVSSPRVKKEDLEDMKYITQRSDGRWLARKTVNGKRIAVYGKTQAEAHKKLQDLIRNNQPKKDTLAQYALWWLETYKKDNVSEKTYKNYAWTIKSHITLSTPLNKVTTVQLQSLLNSLPASRIRKEVYKLLRQIFKKAYELDYIKKDVSAYLTLGKIEEHSREALNIDDQRKIFTELGDDMFSHRVIFYLCTGARPSEISTVKQEELRPGWLKINGTKTKNAVRWIKISDRLYKMLLSESPEFFKFDNKRFRQRLQKFCSDLGITRDVDVYTLRHTYATNLYILRVPEKDRQIYMGHVSGSGLTNNVYTTFSPDISAKDIYDIYGDFYPNFGSKND